MFNDLLFVTVCLTINRHNVLPNCWQRSLLQLNAYWRFSVEFLSMVRHFWGVYFHSHWIMFCYSFPAKFNAVTELLILMIIHLYVSNLEVHDDGINYSIWQLIICYHGFCGQASSFESFPLWWVTRLWSRLCGRFGCSILHICCWYCLCCFSSRCFRKGTWNRPAEGSSATCEY